MRVPLSWLAEWVQLDDDTTPEAVHEALVRVGLEEEEVHRTEISGPVVVGTVLEFVPEPQKNGKTIRWCQVRVASAGETAADGGPDVRGIVCGAGNFEAGDRVVVALPGSVLPGPFPISARKTYGHVSDGMIASARELGLGDDHEGILRLATLGLDPAEGTDAVTLLGLDDSAVEINVTPDRGYAFSVRGVAREYSHATGAPFTDPAHAVTVSPASGYPVSISDDGPIRGRSGASAFVTRVVTGVDASAPTPPWMSARLRLAGVRSISVVVDVTNYVMFELGQPIHAYDLDAVSDGLIVRRAHQGERLRTLDAKDRLLDVEDLVIARPDRAVGLAGVMGGEDSEVTSRTTSVLIEAAAFDPVSIARTARRHKLPSEASRRFERGVDPEVAAVAAQRVVDLLVEHAGGVADDRGSSWSMDRPGREIRLPKAFVSSLVGVDYPDATVRGRLVEIGAEVSEHGDVFIVTPPSWRPDLVDASGLAEEVARIDGYDAIPSRLPRAVAGRGLTRAQRLRRLVGTALAAAGHTEVLDYPFVSAGDLETWGSLSGPVGASLTLANGLDGERPHLRASLLPGLVAIAHRNRSRGIVDLAVFETGSVFLPADRPTGAVVLPGVAKRPAAEEIAALDASLPAQPRHVAGVLTGNAWPKQPGLAPVARDWSDALDAVRVVAWAVGLEVTFRQAEHAAFHPGRTAEVLLPDGTVVGFAGEVLPAVAQAASLVGRVAAWELDLDAMISASPDVVRSAPLRTMTAATQDLSLVVDAGVPAGDVLAAVRDGGGDLLERVTLVDDYRGAGLAEGTKSLTFALLFRADGRTLTAAEASAARDAAAALAAERAGAVLRA